MPISCLYMNKGASFAGDCRTSFVCVTSKSCFQQADLNEAMLDQTQLV